MAGAAHTQRTRHPSTPDPWRAPGGAGARQRHVIGEHQERDVVKGWVNASSREGAALSPEQQTRRRCWDACQRLPHNTVNKHIEQQGGDDTPLARARTNAALCPAQDPPAGGGRWPARRWLAVGASNSGEDLCREAASVAARALACARAWKIDRRLGRRRRRALGRVPQHRAARHGQTARARRARRALWCRELPTVPHVPPPGRRTTFHRPAFDRATRVTRVTRAGIVLTAWVASWSRGEAARRCWWMLSSAGGAI